jgi:hypothetical protein
MRRHRITTFLLSVLLVAVVVRVVAVPAVYTWTPLNRHFERALMMAPAAHAAAAFEHVRVVALTGDTDVAALAAQAGLAGVTTSENRSLRRLHGELMRRLAQAEARAIAWDIAFEGETEFDDAFVAGVEALRGAGVGVVVGTENWTEDELGLPPVSKTILPHVRCGSMTAGVSSTATWRIELALQRGPWDPRPSLALATLAAARDPVADARFALPAESDALEVRYWQPGSTPEESPRWLDLTDRIELTTVATEDADDPGFGLRRGDRIGLLYVPMPHESVLADSTIPYERVFLAQESELRELLAGRVILICDFRSPADQHVDGLGREIRGGYIHAAGIDRLLRTLPVRMPRPADTWLIIVGAAVAGALAVMLSGDKRLRLGILGVLLGAGACVACVVAYQQSQYLCNPLVPLSALVLSVALALLIRREVAEAV